MRISLTIQCLLLLNVFVLSGCSAPQPQPTGTPASTNTPAPQASPLVTVSPTPGAQPSPSVEPTPTLLPTVPVTTPAAGLPSGLRAYFLTPGGQIQSRAVGEAAPQVIATLPDNVNLSSVTLAPDGSAVAYMAGGHAAIRELGSEEVFDITPEEVPLIAVDAGPLNGFRWSPDSRFVLFDLDATGDSIMNPQPKLFIAGREAQPARILTDGLGPVWSPNGTQIAYAGPPFVGSGPHGGGPGGVPTVIAPDGSQPHPLAEGIEVYPEWQPLVWSADGTHLATGNAVFSVNSGIITWRLPESGGFVLGAIQALGSGGQNIGFWRNVRTSASSDPGDFSEQDEFVSVAADGAVSPIISVDSGLCPCMPLALNVSAAWQPAGELVLVAGVLDGETERELRLYRRDGTLIQRIALPDRGVSEQAYWSPDGSVVLLTVNGRDTQEAWAWKLDGSQPVPIGAGIALGFH